MQDHFTPAAQPPMTIWLGRHGSNETPAEPASDGVALPLTEQGMREAHRMADFLGVQTGAYPVLILSSDFIRNIETGKIFREALQKSGTVALAAMPAIRGDDADIQSIYTMMQTLDQTEVYQSFGLTTPPRTLVLIGNKRNMFLEKTRIVIDMKGELTRQLPPGNAIPTLDVQTIRDMAAADDKTAFDDLVGRDSDMELFEEGRLVGYELTINHWRQFPDPDKVRLIADQSFSETGKKWSLFKQLASQQATATPP